MDTELDKIRIYLDEVTRAWEKSPEFVLSRQFFELWESAQKPEPFPVKGDLELLGNTLETPSQHSVAVFTWDPTEEVAVLHVEDDMLIIRYPLYINDGVPEFGDPVSSSVDDTAVSFGERLEFILDIIGHVRDHHPGRNVVEMQKREYLEAVQAVGSKYDERTLRLMNRLRLPAIRKLLNKAVQDMAQDELSDQLVLPLDGNYASAGESTSNAIDGESAFSTHPSPNRTRHQILRDLKFICRTGQALADIQQSMEIYFTSFETLSHDDPMIVRLHTTDDLSMRKGEKLFLMERGETTPIGQFRVILNDRRSLVGEIRWPDVPEELTANHYIKPLRSSAKYLADVLQAFAAEFESEGRFDSAALNAALGVDDFAYEDTKPAGDNGLDESQKRAWANAVNPNNPLTLIQGPPGTGKTHVLEHVLRALVKDGKRVLVAAPSHTAVDNVCKRILDLPVLRIGRDSDKIDPAVRDECWINNMAAVQSFKHKQKSEASIFAGTHLGLVRDDILRSDYDQNGPFDAIILDEAGMARFDEFLICVHLAHRAILFGDHQQLPPFPLPESVLNALRREYTFLREMEGVIVRSPLQWLVESRNIPVFVLQSSYRCQNPRLMRFSSMMFYNAQVKASSMADYYNLPFAERQEKYPSSTLRFLTTSGYPLAERMEKLLYQGRHPGFENELEARLTVEAAYQFAATYPFSEITMIAPYRCQVDKIRDLLDRSRFEEVVEGGISDKEWENFKHNRISTVDSFQGGESDVVIICYVRSSSAGSIGFVDDPNRINVAHTRCRREMLIIGDLEHLKKRCRNRIFHRMERAVERDGEIITEL